MYLLLIILMVIASLLMCLVVLIQNSKGGGLASSFASSNQIMGVRKTTDFLEKATWSIAGFMVAVSILSAYFLPQNRVADSGIITEQALQEQQTSPTNIPDFSAPVTGETPATEQAPADTAH
ncbi:MAG: preprotein translocase subunit SecG [Prevotellaceae bacterium]|jgi:preprotein translocase subunit SecG|nr:preprotein translocase subunit SecG [Prevotellaceae bacterium]